MATSANKVAAMLLGFFVGLSCPPSGAASVRGRPMNNVGASRIEKLFEHTKTVCIGRFILEIPSESQVIYGPAELPYPIERGIGEGENFDEVVQERKREILFEDRKVASGDLLKEDSLLGKVIDGKVPSQKIVFGVSRATGNSYSLESYQRVGNDIYVQEIQLYDKNYEAGLAQLNMVSPLLTPRSDNSLLEGPGICLDGAFLQEPTEPIHEYVTLGVRLSTFDDVHFSIEMTKKERLVETDALEPRIRRAELMARKSGAGKWYDRVKVFRRGARNIANWAGYEYLAWKPPFGNAGESHVFAFVSQGEPSNPMLPVLDVTLDTGVKGNKTSQTKPSITDEEALYLWDKLTSSIRPRPVQSLSPR